MSVSPQEKQQAFSILTLVFPQLDAVGFKPEDVTSTETIAYNCIAYAAKDETQPWWPMPRELSIRYYYWPEGLPREHPATVGNFLKAFKKLGFKQCRDGNHEWGYEKVAIYVDANGVPTHMARNLGDGIWYSKLGDAQDIRQHTLGAVENPTYGEAKYFMRKILKGYPRWKRIAGRILRTLSDLRTSQKI